MRRVLSPGVVLFFLAPAVGELLSGSSPPAEFFNPFTLLLLAGLYGGGALLIHDLAFRWNKGWPTILMLGAAYGILEEGLAVKSFFDPGWMDLGDMAWYGRWLGVNWVWAVHLTLYHMLFSIAAPILLVNLWFPARRHEPWLGRRMRWVIAGLMLAIVLLAFFALTPYRPPLIPYLFTLGLATLLIRWAKRLPNSLPPIQPGKPVSPGWLTLLAFAAAFIWFIGAWLLPQSGLPALFAIGAICGVVGVAGLLALLLTGMGHQATDRHLLALVSGGLGFFILLSVLLEMDAANRPDNVRGMSLVGLTCLLMLIMMGWRLRRAEQRQRAAASLVA